LNPFRKPAASIWSRLQSPKSAALRTFL